MNIPDALPVLGMDALQVFPIVPGVDRLEPEDAPAFFRPTDFVGVEIERPASNMGDALCLGQLIVPLAQAMVGQRTFDRTGDQGRTRFKKIDLHCIPESFTPAIVETQ